MNYLNNKYLIPGAVAVVAVALVIGGLFYFRSKNAPTPANSPQATQDEVKRIVSAVGKLIDLPSGETPTVATVTDISKLKDQPFFSKAKNGDKVLIYTNAKRAILYDPTLKKVLDIAPINMGTSSAQIAQPKIVLRNGTTTSGLTTKVESELKKVNAQINVVSKDNALKQTYVSTLIVILNSSFKDYANSLVTVLKGSILGDLPQDESKPKEGDILIILGKDRI